MKFLKLPRNRISTSETQKIFTKNLRRQKMQLKEDKMLGFIIGLIIGGTAGVFTMALCTAAGQADKRENCTDSDKYFYWVW